MPHKYYHGKTGRIWNVTKRAVGVEVNKRVRGRIIKKRIHVRVEHVKKSASRQAFLDRVKENSQKRKDAKEKKGNLKIFFSSIFFSYLFLFFFVCLLLFIFEKNNSSPSFISYICSSEVPFSPPPRSPTCCWSGCEGQVRTSQFVVRSRVRGTLLN